MTLEGGGNLVCKRERVWDRRKNSTEKKGPKECRSGKNLPPEYIERN